MKYPDGSEDIVYAPVSVGNPTVPSTTHDVDVYQPVYVTDTTVKPNDVHDIPAPKEASGAPFLLERRLHLEPGSVLGEVHQPANR